MRTEYKAYTFKEFLNLPEHEHEEYESTGLLRKPDDWGVDDFMKWPFVTVRKVQLILSEELDYENIIEIILLITGCPIEKILTIKWFHVFSFLKFVNNSIKEVNKLEEKLAYEPDANEERAGIEMYNQFGYFSTVDRLAGGDLLKYEEVGMTEYGIVFTKLLLNKVDAQFIKNYQKIISK